MDITIRVPFVDKVTENVKKHKTEYLLGTAVVMTAGVTFLMTRRFRVQTITIAPVFNNIPV